MKKSFCLLVALVAMFIGIGKVNANQTMICTSGNEGHCTLSYEQDEHLGNDVNYIAVTLRIGQARSFTNLTLNTNDWKEMSRTTSAVNSEGFFVYTFNLKLKKAKMVNQSYKILEFDSYVDVNQANSGVQCSLFYTVAPYCEIRPECSKVDDIYYDKDGTITDESGFKSSCSCHVTRDGRYFYQGIESKSEYIKHCSTSSTCQILDNGEYWNGTSVISEDEYYTTCFEHSCEIYDLKVPVVENGVTIGTYYYNKAGTRVNSRTEYDADCAEKIICKKHNGKYYGNDGRQLENEEEYLKECSTITCQILSDGTMYGKDGKIIKDKLAYEKQCGVHSCEILSDGTHYDRAGNEVTEEAYLKSCFKCRKENDKYYDENGKVTTKENWDIMCTPHKCEIFGDKYFNDKGVLVTKEAWKKVCENPKTGSADVKSISYIISGLLFAGAIIFISVRYNRLRRI